MPVGLYQKLPVAMDHLDALVRGQASACTDILHFGGSVQLYAYLSVPHRATPLGNCAIRRECYENEC